MSNKLQGKRALIFQQRGWGIRIGHFLAKKLQAEGCRLAALTFKKSSHQFHLDQDEVEYDLIINDDEIAEDPGKYIAGDQLSLTQVCDDLDVDSVWPFIVTMRHYARSYADRYYYSYRQNMSDEEIVNYILAVYKYMKKIFSEFQPDLIVVPVFGDMRHIMFSLYADQQGVPMIGVTDTKIRGQMTFSYNYLNSRGPFYDHVDALNESSAQTENRKKAKKYIQEFREKFKTPEYMDHVYKKTPLIKKIKQEIKPYYYALKILLNPMEGAASRLGVTTDTKTPFTVIRNHYTHKKNKLTAQNFDYYPFEKLGKFVYFPLQVQPEATIDVMSPIYNNQIETARQIAQSLPGDYTLVVKDHPAFEGRRSPGYLEKLARTPNVKLIDYHIPNEKVLRECDLIVSPSSTTISEAAFYNKPAIQLGYLGTTQKLPNVFIHRNIITLTEKIVEILEKDLQTEEYERQLENFVAAAYDKGFDFNYLGVWAKSDEENMNELWELYKDEFLRIFSGK